MSDKTKTKAFIITSFRDAGTEEEFESGSTPLIEDGAFLNYKAAGLVRAATEEDAKEKPKTASAKG